MTLFPVIKKFYIIGVLPFRRTRANVQKSVMQVVIVP